MVLHKADIANMPKFPSPLVNLVNNSPVGVELSCFMDLQAVERQAFVEP